MGLYIGLKHVVVLFFGAEALFEDSYVSLVVLMLFLQRFHLGSRGQQFLISFADFHPKLLDLQLQFDFGLGNEIVPGGCVPGGEGKKGKFSNQYPFKHRK